MPNGHRPGDRLEPIGNRVPDLTTMADVIEAKARQLGALAGQATGHVERVGAGWKRAYAGCTIYCSQVTGAFEVHGDIEIKYNALNGPQSGLGLPVTDELPVGDGLGRYNDFEHGSIYWAPHTGPMLIRREIRDEWRAAGGPTVGGYPVRDHYSASTGPGELPISWVCFEDCVWVQTNDGIAPAREATLPIDDLRRVVRSRVDIEMHRSPDNVGLHPQTELESVSPWRHGLVVSQPRVVTIVLHGFRDNGNAPDTNFAIRLPLEFKLAWSTTNFLEPTVKALVAAVVPFLRVTHEGGLDEIIPLLPGAVIRGVSKGLHSAFFPERWPDPAHPEVPQGAVWLVDIPMKEPDHRILDVIDVAVARDGSLKFYVNPLPQKPVDIGIARRNKVQDMINAFLAG